nr:MAG TPA: hypothetical protein [Microviridae sp.]
MKKLYIFCMPAVLGVTPCMAVPLNPVIAIENTQVNCDRISQSFKSMKTMAQVNTAVTAVGTAAGVGATAVGIAKAGTDKQIEKLINDVKQREARFSNSGMTIEKGQDFIEETMTLVQGKSKSAPEQNQLEQKSKNLGNWRTGLLAGNTATNIAGTIIAANNRTDQDLRAQLDSCVGSIKDLQDSKMQAQINNADMATIQKMERIISACRDYSLLNVDKIDSLAKSAATASGIGIAVGASGTIVSATANSDKIRSDNTDSGMAKEKNLNTASNVLAAGATITSGVATIFNAQQISTLDQAYQISIKCSEALNQ